MAPLTKGRNTPASMGEISEPGVAADAVGYAGGMVAVNASGYAVPGATSTTLVGLGRAEADFDNTGGADGDVKIRVGRGIYRYGNSSAADEITASDIGADCYMVDDQTVALTDGTGTRSVAGKIHDVDAHGVWVKFS